ncbi:MAG: hypothetical protein C0405_10035 [Desulfovibrio sp.]|nr:hypothetical protein [Desulfovibrio sp.]
MSACSGSGQPAPFLPFLPVALSTVAEDWEPGPAGHGEMLLSAPTRPAEITGCDAQACRVKSLSPEIVARLRGNPDRLVTFEPGASPADLATLRLFPQVRRVELSHILQPDLGLLKNARELVELRLGRTGMTQLAALRAFPRLTHLVLFEVPFVDGSPLAALKDLRQLDLSRCPQVRDFTFLGSLGALESLLLAGTAFSDLTMLSTMTRLRELSLGQTQVTAGDLDALAGLTRLEGLHLDGLSKLARPGALVNFPELRHLGLSGTAVKDLSVLASLPQLRSLKITRTPVVSLAPLASAAKLHSLFMQETAISDLSPLRGLRELRWLYASRTPVSNLSPLAGLVLTTLDLSGTKVRQVQALSRCLELERLFLGQTAVSDLTPLAGLPLQFLDLSGTKVTSLGPLGLLPKLKSLSIAHTAVTDLSPLAQLKTLEQLDLTGVTPSNPGQLESFPALKKLIFTGRLLPDPVRRKLAARGVELVVVP